MLLAAGALLIFVAPLRNGVLGPVAIRIAAWALADAGTLTVDTLAGSWWGDLELRGVALEPTSADSGLPSVRSRSLRVEYDLLGLVRGELEALHAVEIHDATVGLRLGEAAPDEEPDEPAAPFAWPARLPRVAVDGLVFDLELADGSRLHVAGAVDVAASAPSNPTSTTASPAPQAFGVDLSEAVWRGQPVDPRLAGPLLLEGTYRANELGVSLLRFAGRDLLRATTVEPRDDGVALDTVLAPFAGGLRVSGTLAAARIEVELTSDALDLAPLLEVAALPGLPELEGLIALNASASLDPALPAQAAIDCRLAIEGARVDEHRWDRVDLHAELAQGVLTADQVVVALGEDRLRLNELALPLEALSPEFLGAATAQLDFETSDVSTWLGIETGRVPAHSLKLEVALAPGEGAAVRGSLDLIGGGHVELRRANARLPASSADILEATEIDTELVLDVPDLAALGAIFGRTEWSGRVAGVLEVEGPLLRPTGTLLLDGQDVVVEGAPLGTVDILAGIDPERIEVAALDATGEVGQLLASGRYLFADNRLENVKFSLEVRDFARFGLGRLEAGRLAVNGTLQGDPGQPSGTLLLDGGALELAPDVVVETVTTRATLSEERIVVETLQVAALGATLDASALVSRLDQGAGPWNVAIDRLDLTHEGGALQLVRPANLTLDVNETRLDRLELTGSSERIAFTGRLAAEEWEAGAALTLDGFLTLARPWLPPGTEVGAVDVTVDGRGDSTDWSGAAHGSVRRLALSEGRARGGLDFAMEAQSGSARIERFELALDDGTSVALNGDFELLVPAPADPTQTVAWGPGATGAPTAGSADLQGSFALPELGKLLRGLGIEAGFDGAARGEFQCKGGLGALDASTTLELEGVRGTVGSGARLTLVGPLGGKGSVRWQEQIAFELDLDAPGQARASVAGSAALPANLARLLAEGIPTDVPLDATAEFAVLTPAPAAVWIDAVRSVDGSLEGKATVGGTLTSPEMRGELAWSRGELKLASALPAFDGLDALLRFHGDKIEVAELAGEMGGAPFSLTGTLAIDGEQPVADFALKGKDLLLYRLAGVKVRADADLRVAGALDELTASGKVVLRDSRFVKNVDFLRFQRDAARPSTGAEGFSLFSFREPPLANLRFDIDVSAGEPFRIHNNVVRGGVRPDLHLGGTGLVPELRGPIYLEPTVVSLPTCRVRMTSGTILFDRETWLGPRVELNGEARTRGYDITLVVSGPYDEPEVQLSSIPPLPNDDLVVLLLTGQRPEAADSAAGAQSVAMFLALDATSRWFSDESTEANESLIERVEVFSGGDVTESGAETVEVSFRVTDDELNPRLMYLTGEKDIYDRINFGLRFLFRLP